MSRPRVLLPLAALLFVAQLFFFRGYVTDDTWIYARFAENLARYGRLSFWPTEPIHAATSPLWAALAALGSLAGLAPIDVLMGLGKLSGLVGVLVFGRTALRLLGATPLAVAATLAFTTEIWFVRWSASGMETAIAALWLLVVFALSYRRSAPAGSFRMGVLLGAGFLLRPEALLLSALLAMSLLAAADGRQRRRLVAGLLMAPVLWSAYALPIYGHLLPATLQAKSTPLGLQPMRLLANLRVMGILYFLAIPVVAALWWAVVLSWLGSSSRRRPRRFSPAAAWWAWTVALPLVYLLRDVQLISRYLELLLPVLPLLVLDALQGWGSNRGESFKRWTTRALCLQVAASLVLTLGWVAPQSRDFGRSLEQGLGDLADWIRENTGSDEVVAVYDIGYLGAHCGRRLLDLGGLVEPGINDLRDEVDDAEILRQGLFLRFGTPTILIDRDEVPDALDGWKLAGFELDAVIHRRVANLGLSRPTPVVYTLYRLVPTTP